MDFTPVLKALAGGYVKGDEIRRKRESEAQNLALKRDIAKLTRAKALAERADHGQIYNEQTGTFDIDPTLIAGEQPEPKMIPNPSAMRANFATKAKGGAGMGAELGAMIGQPAEIPDPNQPPAADNSSYRRLMTLAKIKAAASPKISAISNPRTIREIYAIRGIELPASLESIADQTLDHRYMNALPKALTPDQGPATPEQEAAYSTLMNIDPKAAKGISGRAFTAGVSNVRGQQASGERQGKAIAASNERMEKGIAASGERQGRALKQSEQHFQTRLDFDEKKDLQSRIEKFRDDYAKTGIPSTLPLIQRLDELTGIISKENPDKSKLPGVGTNMMRGTLGASAATMLSGAYGGKETNQILQKLLNADIRNMSGQAVSRYEEGRNLVASGMGVGGSEQDVINGIRLMHEALRGAERDVRAAYPKEALDTYEARGGTAEMSPSKRRAQVAQEKTKKAPAPTGETRQYSPSRNQTRVIGPDGKVKEVLDGDRR